MYKRQPLFNLDGEVIGVNSQIYSRSGGYQGVSFAIPVDVAMDVVAQLKDGGKAVSYTHLDVYKRQRPGCVCKGNGTKRGE